MRDEVTSRRAENARRARSQLALVRQTSSGTAGDLGLAVVGGVGAGEITGPEILEQLIGRIEEQHRASERLLEDILAKVRDAVVFRNATSNVSQLFRSTRDSADICSGRASRMSLHRTYPPRVVVVPEQRYVHATIETYT